MTIHFSVPTTEPEAFSEEWQEWNKAVEESIQPEEPEGEVDAWGLPRQPVDNCTIENWNPSDAEVTKFWKEFWEGIMKV